MKSKLLEIFYYSQRYVEMSLSFILGILVMIYIRHEYMVYLSSSGDGGKIK
jgi:hypothetical protein